MYSEAFVCLFGMGTVFVGLICIIILTTIMGKIMQILSKSVEAAPAAAPAAPAAPAAQVSNEIPNRQALVAAISCVLAEEMGTDVTGIRILSLKKL